MQHTLLKKVHMLYVHFLIGVLNEVEQWKIVDDNVIDNELYFLAKKRGKTQTTPLGLFQQ